MKRHLIKISSYFLGTVFVLTSCLKGDPINTPPGGSTAFIAMAYNPDFLIGGGTALNSGLNYFSGAVINYPATDDADTATYAVTIQGTTTFSQDLTVTISADPAALLDNYATDSITYVAMPDSTYSLITTTAVIKAGSTTALFKVAIFPSKIDGTQNYMLPITATTSPSIPTSGNYGHIYLHTIGSIYSGFYTVTGTLVDVIVPTISGYYPMEEQLIPLNGLKVAGNSLTPGIGGNYHPILSGATLSYYGNVGMIFTFDDDNHIIAVTNAWDDPLPRGRSLKIDPSGVNTYDPVAKSFQVKYILAQADVGDRTTFTETWTLH